MDSGALYALFRDGDSWHVRMRDWMAGSRSPLLVPSSVVQESAFLLGSHIGPEAEAALIRAAATGMSIEQLESSDLSRAADLVEAYADFPLGFVDASIVALAERLDITDLLTTDRRHFGVIRPAHCPRLRLLP